MSTTEYVRQVKIHLRDHYKFRPIQDGPHILFREVPNGVYPMNIDGKIDYVEIHNMRIKGVHQ
jgi:hypothetical protein